MRFIGNLLRIYSYVFEAILSLLSTFMGCLILASPHHTVRLGWLPWDESGLGKWLLGLGLLGILLTILAAAGRLRFLLTLFAAAALILITRGLFLSGWRFSGQDELKRAAWLVLGLLVAFAGSIPWPERRTSHYRFARR